MKWNVGGEHCLQKRKESVGLSRGGSRIDGRGVLKSRAQNIEPRPLLTLFPHVPVLWIIVY